MLIKIKVITRARRESITELPDGSFRVRVNAVAEKGRANARVIDLLADYFKKPKSSIGISRGRASEYKTVEIL